MHSMSLCTIRITLEVVVSGGVAARKNVWSALCERVHAIAREGHATDTKTECD